MRFLKTEEHGIIGAVTERGESVVSLNWRPVTEQDDIVEHVDLPQGTFDTL